MGFSTISSWPLLIWKALQQEGHEPDPVFHQAGIDPQLLHQAGARISMPRLGKVWDAGAKISTAPCFGLAAARHWHPTTLHALGIAWFASPTLAEAFRRLADAFALLSTAGRARLERTREGYRFTVEPADPSAQAPNEAVHAAVVVLVKLCRMSLDANFSPRRVLLSHEKSGCSAPLGEFLACPIEFDAPYHALVLPHAELERPLSTANMELLTSAETMIANYLAALDRDDVVGRAKAEILRQLPSGRFSEESIATALHLSLRTFQRRLRDAGTAYRELLESVRRDLALQYVANPRLSITEISYLLGFSEPSSFARTFRRWTGHSPSRQRQDQHPG